MAMFGESASRVRVVSTRDRSVCASRLLVIALNWPMPVAVGTSLMIIALNSAVALAARAGQDDVAWDIIVPFTLTAIIRSLLGNRVADRVNATTLTRAFAALLVLVAVYVAIRAGLALT